MFSKFRSIIFKFDPEIAHTLAIKSLKLNLVNNIFDGNKNDPMFQTTMFGKKLENPIGIAAGFDKNAEVYNSLFNLGFGFVEVGTVTPLEQYGNPKPRVFRLVEDEALINRLGFNNFGAKNISHRIRSNTPKGLLGINLGPNKDSQNRLNDYLIGLKTFHDIANYITINISSPNTENLRDFHDQNKLDKLLKSIELTDNLQQLLNEINSILDTDFNGILVNKYKDGNDYISSHSDDESGISNKGVVSISYGAIRKFRIRDKNTNSIVKDINLNPYQIIHMGGDFQTEFKHEVPVQKLIKEPRYSFTFRKHTE